MTTATTTSTERPAVEPEPILRVEDLHVRYGGSHILQGVSFDVPAKGVTALLGRNGVGKTTTLKAILGLAPRTGRVSLGGEDVTRWSVTRTVREGVGYVPEDREVFGGLTGDGRGVLMVEHHMDVVLDLADRVAVMHHGTLLACDSPDAVMADATVQEAYVGEAL